MRVVVADPLLRDASKTEESGAGREAQRRRRGRFLPSTLMRSRRHHLLRPQPRPRDDNVRVPHCATPQEELIALSAIYSDDCQPSDDGGFAIAVGADAEGNAASQHCFVTVARARGPPTRLAVHRLHSARRGTPRATLLPRALSVVATPSRAALTIAPARTGGHAAA